MAVFSGFSLLLILTSFKLLQPSPMQYLEIALQLSLCYNYVIASVKFLPLEISSSSVSHHSVNLPCPLPLLLLCLFILIPVSFLTPLQAIIICMVISTSSYILIKMYHLQCIFVMFVSILALIHPLNLMFLISLTS